MPQLHLYVPDDVAETAKSRAKAAGKSLSSYLADLVVNEVAGEWPEGFFEEVAGGGLEELHDGVVLERRRVGDVDDDGGTFERVRQAFAREGVDTRGRRGGQHLDALISERGHDFRAERTSQGRTSWSATPRALSMSGSLPIATPPRWPAWCCSTANPRQS